ncbi:MAG: urease accessory protein UreE [Pseudomonadales bacterium]|nr:urease accessory protein UreE [Pseudomonadales bacterium]
MLEIKQRTILPPGASIADSVALDHLQREKGRLKVNSRNGQQLRIFLERGKPLQRGEVLQATSGEYIEVVFSQEPVMTAHAIDWPSFSKACYHFGNRHTRLQIGERWLRFVPDPVLAELATRFGLRVEQHAEIFDPEPGAYQSGHAGHSHSEHSHSEHSDSDGGQSKPSHAHSHAASHTHAGQGH